MIIEDWGLIEYKKAWNRQHELVKDLLSKRDNQLDKSTERIIICEHPAVYTLGFHGNQDNLLVNKEVLKSKGIECIRIERGGDITYHAPGQIVVYPIIDLNRHRLGVREHVELLERSVIELLSSYDIDSTSNNTKIGVWVDWEGKTPRKICAIGIKVSHGVTMHGLALNVNTDMSGFQAINPCGILDMGVTSMKEELHREISVEEIKYQLAGIIRKNILSK